ncbi:MAG: acyl-CoA thioesterase [Actinobacteria bacterium]|nr:acyl-CoA thioesterase [Actinomycetota bacterium]
MDGFSFSTEVRVRFAETDAQGIVHNSNYAIWLELARVEYLERHAGGYNALREQGIEALVTETYIRFGVPVHFDDRVRVWARCVDLRGARFRYEYRLQRGEERVADAWTQHACVDRKTFRPTRIPGWLVEAIGRAEADDARRRPPAAENRAAAR